MHTILLIESNPSILENFTEYFEIEGFRILSANNGTKGVAIAREFRPDLIISAILTNEINGYDVLRLLLRSARTSAIPFIFSTTKCEKSDEAMALLSGADDYIVKPFTMERLTVMAKKWIKSGTQRQD
jgi:DNA-binding response OmpR family regulator